MFELTTSRLVLRPIHRNDASDVEKFIFSDPEVVKCLVHDGSDPNVRRQSAETWCSFGPDGKWEFWEECKAGLFVINDRSGSLALPDEFLGVIGVYSEKKNEKWMGEMFYALRSSHHGKGIMSEAGEAMVSYIRSIPKIESLFAMYWQLLNPASERILGKLGFERKGSHPFLEDYDEETAMGIRNFELWRLANSSLIDTTRVAEEVATKLGHFEKEGITSKSNDLRDILDAIADKKLRENLEGRVENSLEIGSNTLGFAMMRLNS